MVSIRDVAHMAQVSTATVSHVVNGTRNVSLETESRVRQAIDALGYHQNLAARGLKTKNTQIIGMVIPNVMNHYFGSVALGVEKALAHKGYLVHICNTAGDEDLERRHIANLLRHRVDAMVLGPTKCTGLVDEVVKCRVPTVLLDRESECGLPSVRSENRRSSAEAVMHLRANGYPTVAALLVCEPTPSVALRIKGYSEAIDPSQRPIVICLDDEGGAEALRMACMDNQGRLGLFPLNYQALVATLSTMNKLGLRVSVDAGLMAFDDCEWACLVEPAISCVRQRVAETVDALTQTLAVALAGGSQPCICREISPEIVIRGSSTFLGRRD